jgi:hypothetical protein
MLEFRRQARNKAELTKVHPVMRAAFQDLIRRMEAAGYRPRLQDTFRSVREQEKLWSQGRTQRRFTGAHTNTLLDGQPASLAVHLLDDDRPLDTQPEYFARLAIEAYNVGLQTGVTWGLSDTDGERAHREKMQYAISNGKMGVLTILIGKMRGFDPLHVEPPNWKDYVSTDEKGRKP